jgi:hypothetical protein
MGNPFCFEPGIPPGCIGIPVGPIAANLKESPASLTAAAPVKPPPVHRVSKKEHAVRMRSHELVVELGHNQELMAAMRELDDHPESLAEAVADGNKLLKKMRVKLPKGTTVSVKKRSKGWEMSVCVEKGPYSYCYRYNSERGLVYR